MLELSGSIQPASLRYVQRGLRVAAEREAALVVIELDTPGGTLVSLRSMTTALTQSTVPVAVFVSPSGGRAASAGFFLLLAADVAAMAPGTNAGAAHPVALRGSSSDEPEPELQKATEDAAALARALAQRRERPTEWAAKAITESLSYAADEALQRGLIDLVASDRAELLERLDGKSVRRFDGSRHTLALAGADVVVIAPTFAERILSTIADPQVAYLLLTLGMLGLFAELMGPGAILPGVAGGVSLLLAFYALSVLPVSWVGLLLLAGGIGLLVAEAFVISHGLLAVAGLASFVFGSLMLIDTPFPELRIGLGQVLPAAMVLALVGALLLSRAWRVTRSPSRVGVAGLVGEIGELTQAIDQSQGQGKVFVHGEYWAATAEQPLPEGTKVEVQRVEGLRLSVAPVAPAGSRGG